MAFSDITLKYLRQKYGIIQEKGSLFPDTLPNFIVSNKLLEDLAEMKEIPVATEKAKSELIITPILKELWRHNKNAFTFFSGYTFSVKDELNGICDYILSKDTQSIDLQSPIFCLVEAKNRTIEEGYGQCASEMYAAQLFNDREGMQISSIFGCVSNGFDWSFLQLVDNKITIDTNTFQISDLSRLLAVMDYIVKSC